VTGANESKWSKRAGSKSPGRSNVGYDRDSTFVDLELSKSETVEYRSWRGNIEDVDLAWREAEDNGYKFTSRYDDRSSSYACFMFPDSGDDNYGFILAGRGGTPYRALAEVLFKHVAILRGDWRSRAGGQRGADDPDW